MIIQKVSWQFELASFYLQVKYLLSTELLLKTQAETNLTMTTSLCSVQEAGSA